MEFLKAVTAVWPAVLLISMVIGSVVAWFATKKLRSTTTAAQEQMISVYEQTIKVKDTLAITTASSTSKQIEILRQERKDIAERHEAAIAEYRTTLHAVRGELQACYNVKGDMQAELADLKARTDFAPVLEFQQNWYRESQTLQKQTLEILQVLAPVLREVTEALNHFKATTQDVHVVNKVTEPVPIIPAKSK